MLGVPLRHRVLSQQSVIFNILHAFDGVIRQKHKNDFIIEFYFDSSLNLPVCMLHDRDGIIYILHVGAEVYLP